MMVVSDEVAGEGSMSPSVLGAFLRLRDFFVTGRISATLAS